MKPTEFLNALDDAAVAAAIAEAESRTSGQLRVYISHRSVNDALVQARVHFEKLGMIRTRERNAVLLYFAPQRQTFAVIGDTGIHERCGAEFWREVVAFLQLELRAGHFHEAVVAGVQKCGEVLARHFPPHPDGPNELPNEVERGV